MIERHRQQQFKTPFELDPERLLWKPGRKKIFIPPAPKPAFDWGLFNLDTIFKPHPNQEAFFKRMMIGEFDVKPRDLRIPVHYRVDDDPDCAPGRSLLIGDITRSEVAMWRSVRR